MAAGNILLQANDSKVANIIFEDGASGNMSVTVPKEGGTLASEEFVGSAISAIPVVGDATSSVKGIDYKGLLYEAVVTGSARTSIDFPLLDINTHKSYRVEIEMINAVGSLFELYCFVNGDTVVTNYYTQVIDASSTTLASNRSNYPSVASVGASSVTSANSILLKTNGYVNFRNNASYLLGSSIRTTTSTISKTATVTNITQLTFTSSVASAIGVGSKIRIYRGDV